MNPLIIGALGQVAGGAIGNMFGIGAENRADERQLRYMDLQQRMDMQNAEFMRQQQMRMWKDTNFLPQRKELEKAGLNVGLMYKGTGAGGTTQAQTMNSNAPSPYTSEGYGTGMQSMAQNAQLALMNAQKENIEADTKNKEANTSGTNATTEMQEMKNLLQRLFGQEAEGAELHNRIEQAKAEGKMKHGQWATGSEGQQYENKKPQAVTRAEETIENEIEIIKKNKEVLDTVKELNKITGGNLISNDELIQMETNLMKAKYDFLQSEWFKKLNPVLKALIMGGIDIAGNRLKK